MKMPIAKLENARKDASGSNALWSERRLLDGAQSAEGSTFGCINSIATPQHSTEPSPALIQRTSVLHFSHWNRFPSWLGIVRTLRLTSVASAGRNNRVRRRQPW